MTGAASPPPFPLVHVEGAAGDRGYSYGRQAGERIALGLDIYREAFERVGVGWDEAMKIAARFAPKIQEFDGGMLAEIEGIARGAEQSVGAIIVLNARTEIIFWRDNELFGNIDRINVELQEECTSAFAMAPATADNHVLQGQNWDWNPRCVESAMVLRIVNDDGPDILTFVEAGQLARHGLNSHGMGLTVNGLQCDLDCGNIGTPNPLIRRRMLSSDSLAGAIDAVVNGQISFSHSLTLGHAEGAAVTLEATPEGCFWLQPQDGILVHANHFKSPAATARVVDTGLMRCPESLYRDQRALDALRAKHGEISLDTMKAVLSDDFGSPDAIRRTPKARPGGNLSGTVATLLMDLGERKMWLAPSPYLGVQFTEYRLDY